MRTLDPWVSLGTAAAVTSRVRLSTAVALPVEHDPITLAKSIATLDHLSGGRVSVGVGFGWNTDELADHNVPPAAAAHHAARVPRSHARVVDRGGGVVRGRVRQLRPELGVARSRSSRTSRCSSARRVPRRTSGGSPAVADGWITTPRDFDIDAAGRSCCRTPGPRPTVTGAPQIVALDFKPDPDKLARWADSRVTGGAVRSAPTGPRPRSLATSKRLAGKLAAAV